MKARRSQLLWVFCGGTLIVGAVVANWLAFQRQGQDFGALYAVAVGLATGSPIYEQSWQKTVMVDLGYSARALFYPPSTGIAAMPLAALPFGAAQFAWFMTMAVTIILGVRGIVKLSRPAVTTGAWLLVAAAVLFSACIRWGMTPLQGAPLVFGLLGLLVVALHEGRTGLIVFIAAFTTALKFSIAFPFLALLILHRRFGALAIAIATFIIFNVLGFGRVGGLPAVENYLLGVASQEALGTVDTPDPWDLQSVPRLDWPYLLYGFIGDLRVSRALALIAFALVSIWLFFQSLHIQRPISVDVTAIFLIPLVCLGLLAVYHHHYDVSALLVPIIILLARLRNFGSLESRWAVVLMLPLFAMMAVLPNALSQTIMFRLFGPVGQGLLNLAFPVATTLMLIGSLIIVRQVAKDAGRVPISPSQPA